MHARDHEDCEEDNSENAHILSLSGVRIRG